ncbi:MAG: 5-carboxymethyl-2-hydroxymuconate isomerase [Burkholderiaceae bacterium]
MPHLVILYTPNLERELDMTALCRALAQAMLAVRDENNQQVFPTGGTRVLAYPAAHCALSDGGAAGIADGSKGAHSGDYGFAYFNLRMGTGRSAATQQRAGDAVRDCVRQWFAPVLMRHNVGITVQVDESPGQVYDAKIGNLHALFAKP